MIPFILAAVGGYLIGDSFGKEINSKIPKFADGGIMANGERRPICRMCVSWVENRINEMSKEELLSYTGEKNSRLPIELLQQLAFDKMYAEHHDKIHRVGSKMAHGGMMADGGMMAKGGNTETYTYEIKNRDGVLEKAKISGDYYNVDNITNMIQDKAQKYISKDATKNKTGLRYSLFRSNGDLKANGTIRKK